MVKTTPTKVLIVVTFLLAASLASALPQDRLRQVQRLLHRSRSQVDPRRNGRFAGMCFKHRATAQRVTTAEKNPILAAYGYPASTQKSTGEYDHWLPHWMGGSDTAKNI